MTGSYGQADSSIDKRDFDTNRPLLQDADLGVEGEDGAPRPGLDQRISGESSDGLLSNVVEEIVERDRKKMAKEVVRVCSFIWGVISW